MARETTLALAAGGVVDERHAAAVVELRDHLVAEHRSGVRWVELLDVGAAQPAGDHAHERPRSPGLGDVLERRSSPRSDDDGAHRRSLGPRGPPGTRRRYTSSSAGL